MYAHDHATAPEQTDFPGRKSVRGLVFSSHLILPLCRCDVTGLRQLGSRRILLDEKVFVV